MKQNTHRQTQFDKTKEEEEEELDLLNCEHCKIVYFKYGRW